MHVQLEYRVRDADGEAVGPDVERLAAVFGMGQLLPAIERAIDGLAVGAQKQTKLLCRDAYGPRQPDSVLEVERDEFPSDVEPGDYFEVENADRGLLVLRVLEVEADYVLVDLNHPLAGQDLDIDLNILAVRPAERNELDTALELANRQLTEPEPSLISPDSLLRGRGRR
jgi:FKBP-type peptidyl-prolyl cis-trans isomerase 2